MGCRSDCPQPSSVRPGARGSIINDISPKLVISLAILTFAEVLLGQESFFSFFSFCLNGEWRISLVTIQAQSKSHDPRMRKREDTCEFPSCLTGKPVNSNLIQPLQRAHKKSRHGNTARYQERSHISTPSTRTLYKASPTKHGGL